MTRGFFVLPQPNVHHCARTFTQTHTFRKEYEIRPPHCLLIKGLKITPETVTNSRARVQIGSVRYSDVIRAIHIHCARSQQADSHRIVQQKNRSHRSWAFTTGSDEFVAGNEMRLVVFRARSNDVAGWCFSKHPGNWV